MIYLHIAGWVTAILFLFGVVNYYKQEKGSRGKILHMILRLAYLVILFSGTVLFFSYSKINGELIFKALSGFWVIVSMEMITVKTNKKLPTKAWWIHFAIAAIITILLGFTRLPLGILP